MFEEKMSSYATITLEERGAKVLCNAMVTKITPEKVFFKLKNASTGKMDEAELEVILGISLSASLPTIPFLC